MTFALSRDLAAQVEIIPALADTAITAAGGGDDADANGITIDLNATGRQRAECVTFVVQGNAVLAASQTLALPIRVQDSANGSSWADVVDPRTTGLTAFGATNTSAAGAATNQTVTKVSVPTEYLRQYVRVVAKPNLSASGTDTARLQGVAILSGLAKV